MPGARSSRRPAPAPSAASDEGVLLELQLQQQLEEDVARIFDESIYSDIEVVCGKLKILTHSCILKARTKKFYHKLQTILHLNIGRSTFDEIYSFVSDTYTECNIKNQEKEIIAYINDTFNLINCIPNNTWSSKEDTIEPEVFLTPKCISPYAERKIPDALISSPSTELTKEYYALVPIDGNLLERELIEQDALSNAFHSIIKSQTQELNKIPNSQCTKPTSLFLNSSQTSKTVKHSNSCDILNSTHLKRSLLTQIDTAETFHKEASQDSKIFNKIEANKTIDNIYSELKKVESVHTKLPDPTYSPDSLITDDQSSSSDYLSAAYTCSPGIGFTGGLFQLNVGDNIPKMDNIFTSSDSGLENTGLLESLTSHKDVTLADVSLTESTLHDLTTDDASNSHDSMSSPLIDKCPIQRIKSATSPQTTSLSGNSCDKDLNCLKSNSIKLKENTSCKSSKEEKQRQNEEIVILESSSLSSETGSWESVFPPKLTEKDICEKFINNERQHFSENALMETKEPDPLCPSLVQKSPFKSTSCFIDAASLVDEEDETIKVSTETSTIENDKKTEILPIPSEPVPCCTNKQDMSPNDWSESNENDDSLEQAESKDPDFIQKDLSPTIFEMTPITEDSLCANVFDSNVPEESTNKKKCESAELDHIDVKRDSSLSLLYTATTPHNSIMSLKAPSIKQYDSTGSINETDYPVKLSEGIFEHKKNKKCNESSPIISGGASVEDHLPHVTNYSPLTHRKLENVPIVSGAYMPQLDNNICNKSPKPSCSSAWVVDMSNNKIPTSSTPKKPGDKVCESLRPGSNLNNSLESCNKSRSSGGESDSSEKSYHKFYIDLATLSDTPIAKDNKHNSDNVAEKKNIFSMYIDLGENKRPALKEMPARLTSSLNMKKNNPDEIEKIKNVQKNKKCAKTSNESNLVSLATHVDQNNSNDIEKHKSLEANIIVSEIISSSQKNDKENTTNISSQKGHSKYNSQLNPVSVSKTSDMSTLSEENTNESSTDLFVKLSDLDKPIHKIEKSIAKSNEAVVDVRMTRSIPENNWGGENRGSTAISIEVISSFHSENALSLNRLFPHLQNEFSRSMPGSLSARTRSPLRLATSSSPGDGEEPTSDMSEISSVQSSMCRSVIENSTTEETSQTSSLIGNCQSRLGQDLLRMFLEEIAPDVIVEVSGRRIKAHKCILSSRCQYFAGILSGGWVESAGNVILLPPFAFNVVHFALCHIYSGVASIPDSISIVELATLADMLGLEGLKEAIMYTLKSKYCHHFHLPCSVCSLGVLECLLLSALYGLDDLCFKCLKWITKHFSKVWPTKAFAALPADLSERCYQQHIINMTIDNVVDTIYGCGIIIISLQTTSRGADVVERLCRRLLNASADFIAPRVVTVVSTLPLPPCALPQAADQALGDCINVAIERAPADQLCKLYVYLSTVLKSNEQYVFHRHACLWRLQCERTIVRAAPRVVGTQAFKELPVDLAVRLRKLGCIMFSVQKPNMSNSPAHRRRSANRDQSRERSQLRHIDINDMRARFTPYASKPILSSPIATQREKINPPMRNPPQVRTTKAQEERAKYNMAKSTRPVENKTRPKRVEHKSKLGAKIQSSSESSRHMSEAKGHTMSQDSLATSSRPRTAEPSSSLSESQNIKYATYTKSKRVQPEKPMENNKIKTKIPVYINNKSYSSNRKFNDTEKDSKPKGERKFGSLMMATKSSTAKMVQRQAQPARGSGNPMKQAKTSKHNGKADHHQQKKIIPTMERSGTFLKDEPTFGDKTTKIA